jgi:hypothetical protein
LAPQAEMTVDEDVSKARAQRGYIQAKPTGDLYTF